MKKHLIHIYFLTLILTTISTSSNSKGNTFLKNLNRVILCSSSLNHSLSEMTLVKDHIWEIAIPLKKNGSILFLGEKLAKRKFKVRVFYGDIDNDGIVEKSSHKIFLKDSAGEYLIRFNDHTYEYSVKKLTPFHYGNVTIKNQKELNKLKDIGVIVGNLIIDNTKEIVSLSELSFLKRVTGFLQITNNESLATLNGLEIKKVGSGLFISNNPHLSNIEALKKLSLAGSMIIIENNNMLANAATQKLVMNLRKQGAFTGAAFITPAVMTIEPTTLLFKHLFAHMKQDMN